MWINACKRLKAEILHHFRLNIDFVRQINLALCFTAPRLEPNYFFLEIPTRGMHLYLPLLYTGSIKLLIRHELRYQPPPPSSRKSHFLR